MRASPDRIEALRRRLARFEDRRPMHADRFLLGHEGADRALGGLSRKGLHEVYPATSMDMASADGFALGLARQAGGDGYIAWIVQSMSLAESGLPYGEGLRAWGVDPGKILLVRARDAQTLLSAAEEALRSRSLGAVMMSAWGSPGAMTLTAGRRLALAAQGGTTAILVRAGAEPQPGSVETRWLVASAPSRPLEADAPGRPTLRVSLMRSRAGAPPQDWMMEWDGETGRFVQPAPVSRRLVPMVADRPAADVGPRGGFQRAG